MNADALPPVHVGDGDDWSVVNRAELRAFVRAVLADELAGEDGLAGPSFILVRYIRDLQAGG